MCGRSVTDISLLFNSKLICKTTSINYAVKGGFEYGV